MKRYALNKTDLRPTLQQEFHTVIKGAMCCISTKVQTVEEKALSKETPQLVSRRHSPTHNFLLVGPLCLWLYLHLGAPSSTSGESDKGDGVTGTKLGSSSPSGLSNKQFPSKKLFTKLSHWSRRWFFLLNGKWRGFLCKTSR